MAKKGIYQIKHPYTGKYVKYDESNKGYYTTSTKQSAGPYKGVPICVKSKTKPIITMRKITK